MLNYVYIVTEKKSYIVITYIFEKETTDQICRQLKGGIILSVCRRDSCGHIEEES